MKSYITPLAVAVISSGASAINLNQENLQNLAQTQRFNHQECTGGVQREFAVKFRECNDMQTALERSQCT